MRRCPENRLSAAVSRGFTLVETLVVLAIAAGMMGAAVYGLNIITAADLRDEAMRITSVMQYTWSRAAVEQVNYRLVLDLDTNTYWTEVSDAAVVKQVSDANELRRERAPRGADPAELEAREEQMGFETDPFGISRPTDFSRAESAAIDAKNFHEGVEIYQVLTTRQDQPIREGQVAVSFFPDGFQEPVIIVLKDARDAYYSIINEPLTGRVKIYSSLIEDRERLDQGESDD